MDITTIQDAVVAGKVTITVKEAETVVPPQPVTRVEETVTLSRKQWDKDSGEEIYPEVVVYTLSQITANISRIDDNINRLNAEMARLNKEKDGFLLIKKSLPSQQTVYEEPVL